MLLNQLGRSQWTKGRALGLPGLLVTTVATLSLYRCEKIKPTSKSYQ